MTFNPATAYKSDWQHLDWIELADYYTGAGDEQPTIKGLRISRGDITHPDYRSVGAGINITSRTAAFTLWNPTDQDFEPRPDGVIATDDGVRWIIKNVIASRFGRWLVAADKQITNA